MLIPSIDLQGGRIVQLVQGERLALASDDFEGWIAKFAAFPKVQLIDLDAAKNQGNNRDLVASICRRLPCRVGGGVRTVDDVQALFDAGATKVIAGSRLFRGGTPDVAFAESLATAIGATRLIAAVDAKGGYVVIDGWRTQLAITPSQAIQRLEPWFDEFLFTNVDVEGLMRGIDRPAIETVRAATAKAITVAGGVTTEDEIAWLDALGMDAVAGMAVYTGRLTLGAARSSDRRPRRGAPE
jgi:phosphoribosylformimino-5-aminoimidazole carboxamide ribotide isomerase